METVVVSITDDWDAYMKALREKVAAVNALQAQLTTALKELSEMIPDIDV